MSHDGHDSKRPRARRSCCQTQSSAPWIIEYTVVRRAQTLKWRACRRARPRTRHPWDQTVVSCHSTEGGREAGVSTHASGCARPCGQELLLGERCSNANRNTGLHESTRRGGDRHCAVPERHYPARLTCRRGGRRQPSANLNLRRGGRLWQCALVSNGRRNPVRVCMRAPGVRDPCGAAGRRRRTGRCPVRSRARRAAGVWHLKVVEVEEGLRGVEPRIPWLPTRDTAVR